jgi:hypothetical protein
MKMIFRLVAFGALIALGIWLWLLLFPGPEKIIQKQLAKLAQAVSFSATEGNLAKLAAAQKVAGFFSANVEVNVNVPGHERQIFAGREEITQAAMATRSALNSLAVKFPDVNVTLAPDKNSAVADVTLEASVSGQPDLVVEEMKFTLEKSAGKWLIKKIETVRVLS